MVRASEKSSFRRWIHAALLLLPLAIFAIPSRTSGDEGAPAKYSGRVDYISDSAVEVGGHRGLISSRTVIISDRRAVALSSVCAGMQAEMEVDPDGQVLQLKVEGAIE